MKMALLLPWRESYPDLLICRLLCANGSEPAIDFWPNGEHPQDEIWEYQPRKLNSIKNKLSFNSPILAEDLAIHPILSPIRFTRLTCHFYLGVWQLKVHKWPVFTKGPTSHIHPTSQPTTPSPAVLTNFLCADLHTKNPTDMAPQIKRHTRTPMCLWAVSQRNGLAFCSWFDVYCIRASDPTHPNFFGSKFFPNRRTWWWGLG